MLIGDKSRYGIEVRDHDRQMVSLDVFVDGHKLPMVSSTYYVPALQRWLHDEILKFSQHENFFKCSGSIHGENIFEKFLYLKSYSADEFDPDYYRVQLWGESFWGITSYLIPFEDKVHMVCEIKDHKNGEVQFLNTIVGFGNYFYVIKTLDEFLDEKWREDLDEMQ